MTKCLSSKNLEYPRYASSLTRRKKCRSRPDSNPTRTFLLFRDKAELISAHGKVSLSKICLNSQMSWNSIRLTCHEMAAIDKNLTQIFSISWISHRAADKLFCLERFCTTRYRFLIDKLLSAHYFFLPNFSGFQLRSNSWSSTAIQLWRALGRCWP